MIELARHIEILLLSNDCVIVPAFGGFMAHHVDARYDEQDGTFLPPLRTLGFNPQLQLNDSLLAQSYIEAYDISYPEALRRIDSEVGELKHHLAETGRYELNDIGVISLNQDGHYEFAPCEAGILTPAFYGLSSFELAARSTEEKVAAPTEQEPSAQVVSIKVSTLRNLAAACVAVIAILLFPHQLSNTQQPVANTQVNKELLQRVMPKDVTTGKPEKIVEVSKTPVQTDEVAAPTDEVAAPTDEVAAPVEETAEKEENTPAQQVAAPAYTIVLASQVSKKNAEYFVAQLGKKGLQEGRVMTGKFTRVVYGNFPTEAAAYNTLRQLRESSSDFAEGWVMEIKN